MNERIFKQGRTRKSFTLIELLIVMAIIAILAAMLLPALNKARDQAYKIKCTGNQKQLMLGFLNYAHDNRELVPATFNDAVWTSKMSEQLGIPQKMFYEIIYCPSLLRPETTNLRRIQYNCYGMRYGPNHWPTKVYEKIDAYLSEGKPAFFIQLKTMKFPSSDMLLGCSANEFTRAQTYYVNIRNNASGKFFAGAHQNTMSAACLDGHVGRWTSELFLNETQKEYIAQSDTHTTTLWVITKDGAKYGRDIPY